MTNEMKKKVLAALGKMVSLKTHRWQAIFNGCQTYREEESGMG